MHFFWQHRHDRTAAMRGQDQKVTSSHGMLLGQDPHAQAAPARIRGVPAATAYPPASSPNVWFSDDDERGLILEYMPKGSLRAVLESSTEISMKHRLRWCIEAAEAVVLLHSHGII